MAQWPVPCRFPSGVFTVQKGQARTNNHVEGWHIKVTWLTGKTEQAAMEVTLRQLEAGVVFALTRKVYRTKEKRLKTIQRKFTNCTELHLAIYWVGFRS